MEQSEEKARQIEAEIGEAALDNLHRQIETEVNRAAAGITTASAWIDHYLLIDFGFTPNVPYEPNSVQFYSASGFLCWKRTDNTSIQTLAPILACKYVYVTWDTSTQESVHIYGFQPKP
jgi:hypothetical protein